MVLEEALLLQLMNFGGMGVALAVLVYDKIVNSKEIRNILKSIQYSAQKTNDALIRIETTLRDRK